MHVEIKILIREQIRKEVKRMYEDVKDRRGPEKEYAILVTPEVFPKIFTQKRLELLMELKRKHAKTVSELAERLHRPFEVVHRDLKLLEHYELVKLTKMRRVVIPELAGDIHVSMAAAA